MSFRLKIILGIGLIESILLAVLIWTALDLLQSSNERELQKRATAIAALFATTSKEAVLSTDLASLESLTQEILTNPGIVYARVVDNERVLAEAGAAEFLQRPFKKDVDIRSIDDGVFDVSASISHAGTNFGRVEIGLSTREIDSVLRLARRDILLIALAGIVLSALFLVALGYYLAKQLKGLQDASARISAGELGYQIMVMGRDEIAVTARAFNQMSLRLAAMQGDLLAKHEQLKEMAREKDDLFFAVSGKKKEVEEKNRALEKEIVKRHQAEEMLRDAYNELDLRVWERTAQLERANLELLKARELAEAATQSKSEFLANMSHEIRTPLNAVIGITGLALQLELSSKLRNYLNTVQASARSLMEIINDILDLSKIEAGRLDLEIVKFRLADVLDRVHTMFQYTAQEKGIELSIQKESDVPVLLQGDPLRLGQVLINLSGNAIKFTEQGEVSVRVTCLEHIASNVRLQFSVHDTGIGIAPEHQDQLFNAFTQADGSMTRRYGGTGLGLTICKRLVEQMEGEIWIESEPGQGSTFFFSAIFGYPTDQEETDVTDSSAKPGSLAPGEKNFWERLCGSRVLVVEDNAINRQVALEVLANVGILAKTANNGLEAVEMVGKEFFDCVLMDMQMPELDGLSATRMIRQDQALAGLPIIAMTAHTLQGDREMCLAAGMNDYVLKPIEAEVLFNTLSKWVAPQDRGSVRLTPVNSLGVSVVEQELTPVLAGIDMVEGLKRLGINRQEYEKLLLGFAKDHADAVRHIRVTLAEGDLAAARRMAHSLKGVAANMAAPQVQRTALDLEKALKKGSVDENSELLDALDKALCQVVASIQGLATKTEGKTVAENPAVTKELPNIIAVLETLAALLDEGSVEAEVCMASIEDDLRARGLGGETALLTRQISSFDFSPARKTLAAVAQKLKAQDTDSESVPWR